MVKSKTNQYTKKKKNYKLIQWLILITTLRYISQACFPFLPVASHILRELMILIVLTISHFKSLSSVSPLFFCSKLLSYFCDLGWWVLFFGGWGAVWEGEWEEGRKEWREEGGEKERARESERERERGELYKNKRSAMTPDWKAFLLANRMLNLSLPLEWNEKGMKTTKKTKRVLRVELKVTPLQTAIFQHSGGKLNLR